MTRTRKPCPGCGEVKPWRTAASVCSECRRDLDAWKDHLARQNAGGVELMTVILSQAAYAWPGFYNGATGCNVGPLDEHRDGLEQSFHDLAYRLAAEVFPEGNGPDDTYQASKLMSSERLKHALGDGQPGWFVIPARMTTADVELFRRLYEHAAVFARLCYLAGVNDGQDVLRGLASGQLSLAKLEDFNVRQAAAVQEEHQRARIAKRPRKRSA